MFLKVEQKLTGRGCLNNAIVACENRNIAREKFLQLQRKIFQLPVFEGKRINFGASKLKLRRFEIRCFCDKMRPF